MKVNLRDPRLIQRGEYFITDEDNIWEVLGISPDDRALAACYVRSGFFANRLALRSELYAIWRHYGEPTEWDDEKS